MRYRKLDSSGDFVPGLGAYYSDNSDSVPQAIRTRLLLWLGEWFLDTSDGTDWDGRVLGERTQGLFEDELKGRILLTPNVVQITSFNYQLDTDNRSLAIQARVDIANSSPITLNLALSV